MPKEKAPKAAIILELSSIDVGEYAYLPLADHTAHSKKMSAIHSAIKRNANVLGTKEFSTSLWTAVRDTKVRYLVAVERTA